MDAFVIAPAIAATSAPLARLGLCEARLQADARWPWIALVPRRPNAREIEDLSPDDRCALIEETLRAGLAVKAIGHALGRPVEKLNIGALGNITPQLHVHVVGRRADDPAWPGPVWGVGQAVAYERERLEAARAAAMAVLEEARALFPPSSS